MIGGIVGVDVPLATVVPDAVSVSEHVPDVPEIQVVLADTVRV
jgi:hypothetical protein